jgi:hypothetical protein
MRTSILVRAIVPPASGGSGDRIRLPANSLQTGSFAILEFEALISRRETTVLQ